MIFKKLLYLCGMLALIIAILSIVAIVFCVWFIGYNLRRIDDYKFMTKEDYQQLNKKAKQIYRVHQARKAEKKAEEQCCKNKPYRSTIPCMDHNITY